MRRQDERFTKLGVLDTERERLRNRGRLRNSEKQRAFEGFTDYRS